MVLIGIMTGKKGYKNRYDTNIMIVLVIEYSNL